MPVLLQRLTLRRISVGVGLSLIGLALFWWWFYALPVTLFVTTHSSIVLDRNGKLLSAHIAADEQWRFPELEQVPDKFAQAITAFEDKRFYQHSGVDVLALCRALYLNLKYRKVISGGSTLTMQVIRLARANPPRTLVEKALELLRALRLEQRLSKEAILSLYASHAPFGGNVVGLEAAAWRYFARSPEQLSWAESALLAVLPNNPALIHLGRNREQLLAKRNRLLSILHERQHLSDLDYHLALAEPLPDTPHALPQQAPHLLDTLAQTTKVGQRFHTTIDANLQQPLQDIAQRSGEQLALEGVQNLAILVLDNHDFSTLGYIGNRPNGDYAIEQGHAIDLIQRPRSTGSTLKPFLFADMLEQGQILPDSLVADVPVSYSGFTPKNYNRNYHGVVPAHEALARSLNIPMVNLLSQRGVEPFLMQLKQLGLKHLTRPARDYGLSLILGGAEASLWELTTAYANLAHRAQQDYTQQQSDWQQARLLQTDVSSTGRVATFSTATAWLTIQALLEVARPGDENYWEKFSSSRKVAWKTGTSYGHRDAWAIGMTPDYTVGVWVGNADGEGRVGLTGTQSAAPILFNVFSLLPAKQAWFQQPDWQLTKQEVCNDDGYLSNGLCDTKSVLAPANSHFSRLSPYHQRIHLDASEQWRVTSDCESVSEMQTRNWFVLPPEQAYYYRQFHADYQVLPPFRSDCQTVTDNQTALTLVYPQPNTQIYLPRELDGKLGKSVFKAVTNQPATLLYWHLDNEFMGTTQTFHQLEIQTTVGKHKITLVDETGHRIEQEFEVLATHDN